MLIGAASPGSSRSGRPLTSQTDLAKMRQQIRDHDHDIDAARSHASEAAAQAFADAKAELGKFDSRLTRASALDLQGAIAGLFINTIGVAPDSGGSRVREESPVSKSVDSGQRGLPGPKPDRRMGS
ncbi:hypothetical protein GCM10023094_34570 [Rhodococcus olei]|uniref:Uncharacterized protein n=1 Tax=Rhodococcus olei TaxID=2161675 RepID=A0ABP8P7D6_9NOCA